MSLTPSVPRRFLLMKMTDRELAYKTAFFSTLATAVLYPYNAKFGFFSKDYKVGSRARAAVRSSPKLTYAHLRAQVKYPMHYGELRARARDAPFLRSPI